MSRARTEAEYLASIVPASVRDSAMGRRGFLKGSLAAGGALSLPALLAACGGGSSGGGSGSGTVTLGSNYSDPVPKKVMAAWATEAKAKTGQTIKVNTVDHTTFQNNINNYLQGSPDDVFSWFAGYRMRFFAAQGLAGDISDVWKDLTGFTDAFKKASTGDDGKQYFVPTAYGPWAVFYRKSLWQEKGYQVPQTYDELVTLATKMKADGLVPIAHGDKDGWEAMGWFDQINMRTNGYDFHISLLDGKEDWSSDKVKNVFSSWARVLPMFTPGALGLTWQEAATDIIQKKAGMMLLGSFISQQFDAADQGDIAFFNFPEVDPAIGTDAVEAPLDGFMMSHRPKNEAGAKKLLTYLGSPQAGLTETKIDPSQIAANTNSSTAGYTPLQQECAKYVSGAKSISQFLDRDTRPDFAQTVMIPALQTFLKNPSDIDGLTSSIQKQAKTIFTS